MGHPNLSARFFCSTLYVIEHFFGVSVGLDVFEHVADIAVGTDQEGSTRDPNHRFTVHILFFQDFELCGNLFFWIGEQGVRKFVLFLEVFLRLGSIGRDAEHNQPGLLKFYICVAEPARFYRSTGSVGFGIKEKHNVFPAELFQPNAFSVLVEQSKIGCFHVGFHA